MDPHPYSKCCRIRCKKKWQRLEEQTKKKSTSKPNKIDKGREMLALSKIQRSMIRENHVLLLQGLG
jgi:hypothetical protein